MGKSKSSSKKSLSDDAPRCTCDHPYQCKCGNRPERPSKGHRWDPEKQEWGGKGHKQKGASGQTASVAAEAKTTAVGKTQIAQWQRLPSQLLSEVCKKEGRPPPKFKDISNGPSKQKYRVIVQDAKVSRRGTDHDFLFVPAKPCDNPEQAKEEAALLALLNMTPKLPHERKLPEPYRTTWIHAVEASKDSKNAASKTTKSGNKAESSERATSTSSNRSGAKATTDLAMGRSFVSLAEKRRQKEEKRKAQRARIQHHLAVLEANRDHQVFLSAPSRRQIESLLRGDAVNVQELFVEHDENDSGDEETDEVKAYVVERLHGEGFTKAQARTAFGQLASPPNPNLDEEMWDGVYDECLQWLCIHLDEEQLPEGFDPRGRTLDVVIAPSKATCTKEDGGDTNGNESVRTEAMLLAKKYNLPMKHAVVIAKRRRFEGEWQQDLWERCCAAIGHHSYIQCDARWSDEDAVTLKEELEALQAIFSPETCSIDREEDGRLRVKIALQPTVLSDICLEMVVREGCYPTIFPELVILSGGIGDGTLGASLHIELARFLFSLPSGTPIMYELYNQAMTLVRSAQEGELQCVPLFPDTIDSVKETPDISPKKSLVDTGKTKRTEQPKVRRPRERGVFWSTSPQKTPKAIPFPKVSISMEKQRSDLPAAKAKLEFLSAMKKADQGGRVLLLTGETGCGKSTQIPQFLLEDAPGDVKIVVAQPRRLAATGVAARVADERGEGQPGKGSVGYVVRGESAVCKSTRLLFCTTGVLLRQLQSDGALDSITHIVVDEVHERHLDTDVLLGILKQSLGTTPHLRVVLMSATLDADRFAAYWGSGTPRVHIPGRTFPVKDYVLEDVLSITQHIPSKKSRKKGRFGTGPTRPRRDTPWADSEMSDEDDDNDEHEEPSQPNIHQNLASSSSQASHTIPLDELVKRVDQENVDYDMLGKLIKQLVQTNAPGDRGSILVFLSGAPEINSAMETIRKITKGMSLELLPLHGGLQPKEQNLVFLPAQKAGCTKVILSTNVAETSITIPDCTIVIDSCREKQSSYDPSNRMPLLVEKFAAQDSLKQRRGRAGRVQSGTCYKLISKALMAKLPAHSEPEIRRCALDQTLLSLMFLGVEDGTGKFLTTLLDPPSQKSIDAAIFSLRKLGAITSGTGNSCALTPLGMHLAGIPAPPTVSKLLVMGSILGCRSASLAMAAGMSVGRSPFLRIDNRRVQPKGEVDEKESIEVMKRNNVLQAREQLFKRVGNSDHAMLAAAYLKWDSVRTGSADRKRFCESLGLSFNGMRDMKQLVRQFDSSLAGLGYVASEEADRNSRSWRIIRACAVAAMAPSQLVRVQRPKTKYTETAEGAVEKDGVAKELQFYIRRDESTLSGDSQEAPMSLNRRYHNIPEERVFFHPSSANFSVGSYHCPWLVYHELVRTSKAFLRDATECSAYGLLLFGGSLDVQAGKGLIVVDGWARLAANARIGALIGGLRRRVEELLDRKIKDVSFDIVGTVEMKLIVSLLVSDGLGE